MIAPSGFLQAISPLAQGSMSDRELYKQAGFNEMLHPGDGLLVDRGFVVYDMTMRKKAKLVIPDFLKGRKKFTYRELVNSRLITRAR